MHKTFLVNIPVDNDNFIEMQCPYCKSRLRINRKVWENGTIDKLFCPSCGLPDTIQSFITNEVRKNYYVQANNYINSMVSNMLKGFKSSKFIKFDYKPTKNSEEHPILFLQTDVSMVVCKSCGGISKVREIDKIAGYYCPICGDENND